MNKKLLIKTLAFVLAFACVQICVSANAYIPKVYLDEDFFVYSGGIPEGWSHLTEDNFSSEQIKAMKVNDSAMEIASGNNHKFMYKFSEKLMSGIYKIGFDIQNNDVCRFGLVPQAALVGDEYVRASDHTVGMTLDEARDKNKLFREEGTLVEIPISDDMRHFDITFDMDAGTYSIESSDMSVSDAPIGTILSQRTVVYNINTGFKDMIHGIGAMSLVIPDGAYVRMSGFSITKAESFEAYQNFDTFKAGVKNAWYRLEDNSTSGSLEKYMEVTDGRNVGDDTQDRALTFNFDPNYNKASFLFNRPIKAGTPFVVEYDIKTNESARFGVGNAWSMGLMNEIDVQSRLINTHSAKESQTGEGKGAQSNYAFTYTTTDVLLAQAVSDDNKYASASGKILAPKYHEFNLVEYMVDGLTYNPGEWHHIYAEITPGTSSYDMNIKITHENGEVEESTVKRDYLSAPTGQSFKLNEVDIYGLRFGNGDSWRGGKITLDNLKVYSLSEVSFEPLKAKLDKELYPRENTVIKLHFSEEPSNPLTVNKENISITRVADGADVDFDIEKVSDKNYKLNILGEIGSGKHNITFGDSIKGKYSNSVVCNKLSFKTEPKKNDDGTIYPEVSSIKIYDMNGKEIDINSGGRVTSKIDRIEIKFNTKVQEESANNNILLYEDSKICKCNYIFKTENDDYGENVTVAVLQDFGFLPSSEYMLKINSGIVSKADDSVVMELGDSINFSTQKEDAGCVIVKNYYNSDTGKYEFKLFKNDKSTGRIALVITNKSTVVKDGKTYQYLKKAEFIPIELTSDFKGAVIKEVEIEKNDGDDINAYLWSYPDMQKINIENDGSIVLKK